MGNNYDLILKFILDEASKQKTEAGADALNKKLEEVEKHVHDINQAGHDPGLVRAMDEAAKVAQNKLNPALKQSVKHQHDLADSAKRAAHEAHLQMQVFSAQSMLLSSQASQMTKRASEMQRISSRIQQYSTLGLAVGGAVVGGIFAEANRFAKEAEGAGKATQATREWTKATRELAEARARVDTVLLREALPLLQQAAKVANQAAAFVEKHPQIVEASLKVGTIVAGLSAIGIVAAKGIQLNADRLYLAAVPIQLRAAKLMAASASQMLVAAQLHAEASGVEVTTGLGGGDEPKATDSLGKGANIIENVSKAILLAAIARAAVNFGLDKLNQPKLEAMFNAELEFAKQIPKVLNGTEKLNDLAAQVVNMARATVPGKVGQEAQEALARQRSITTGGASASASLSFTPPEVVRSFEKWKEDDRRIIQEAAENRKKIIANAEKQIADATRQYAQQRASIIRQAEKARADIITNFADSSKKAEQDYAKQRAEIIKDAGEEIQKIEAQHQENIRKLTMEHNDRVEELTAARDALGLAKEQRAFDRSFSEAERETNQEIAQRRRDIAIRLQDLAAEFAAERAQRQADFEEQLAENAQNKAEQLKEAAATHQNEMQQLRANKAQQLRELQEGLNAERKRRRDALISEIRDIDAGLLGERKLRQRYQIQMLADLDRFLAEQRAKVNTIVRSGASGTAGARAEGGYASYGRYTLGERGQEFVMNSAATRAAENIIGRGLTQDALLSALARGAGNSRSVTIHDQSRFDGRISAAEVRAIQRETRGQIFKELFDD